MPDLIELATITSEKFANYVQKQKTDLESEYALAEVSIKVNYVGRFTEVFLVPRTHIGFGTYYNHNAHVLTWNHLDSVLDHIVVTPSMVSQLAKSWGIQAGGNTFLIGLLVLEVSISKE